MKRQTTLDCYNFTLIKRPKITSEILDLPTDVMILIFKLLTPSERRNATTVCNQWLDLVNQYFCKDNCLVLSSDLDYSTTGSLYQTFSNHLPTKRSFSHMKIETFPSNTGKLSLMENFIEIVSDEIKSLKIGGKSSNPDYDDAEKRFDLKIFGKLSRLETLEVSSAMLLADLSSSTSLKRINVLSSSYGVEHLENFREVKSLESLTMSGIGLTGREVNDETLVSFLDLNTKKLVSKIIACEPYDGIILKAPNFNFCGVARLTPDDISGISLQHCDKPLSQKILSQFKNMKRLTLFHFDDSPLILTANRVIYAGITELELDGSISQPPPNFDQFLQSFPDLEKLKIYGFCLKNEHFSLICEFMPKLKELVLLGPWLKISIGTLLCSVVRQRYALEDLQFLEKLEIWTKFGNNSGQWPSLPHLKELSLHGDGCSLLSKNFYSQIAQKCPKLTHVTINYINSGDVLNFLPLLQHLKLTHLSLPNWNTEAVNTELIANLIKYCQELKEIIITGCYGFSLPQEMELFSNISSLMKVSTWPRSDEDDDVNRVMKRKDAKNLKGYLGKVLSFYEDPRKTVKYVAENVIPPNEFQEMQQLFANGDEDDEAVKKFYIVTHHYLGMSCYNVSKLFYHLIDRE